MVLQPLIQRILRVFCTFKEIRNIFVDIRLADNLQALVDRQMANESKNRTGPGKSFRQSGFHAQILRLIQILKSWSKLLVSNHQKFIEIKSIYFVCFFLFFSLNPEILMVWTKLYIENNLPFSTSKYKSIFVREITFLLKWQINFVAKHLRILCMKATAGMIQSLFLVFWLVQCLILDGFRENWIPSIFSFFVRFSFCDAKCRYRISSIVWHRKKIRNLENLSIFSVKFANFLYCCRAEI